MHCTTGFYTRNFLKFLGEPFHWNISQWLPEAHSETNQTSKMEFFKEIFNSLMLLSVFCKKLYPRCLTEFWMYIWLLFFSLSNWSFLKGFLKCRFSKISRKCLQWSHLSLCSKNLGHPTLAYSGIFMNDPMCYFNSRFINFLTCIN